MKYKKFLRPAKTRKEAKKTNNYRYLSKTKCPDAKHKGIRYTITCQCVECARERASSWQSVDRVKRWFSKMTHKQKMLHWAKYRHKKNFKDSQFDLTEADLHWPIYCPALGIELLYESSHSRSIPNTATLDRIDSNLGYIKGNVQILSRKANLIKNYGTPEEVMRVATFMQRVSI